MKSLVHITSSQVFSAKAVLLTKKMESRCFSWWLKDGLTGRLPGLPTPVAKKFSFKVEKERSDQKMLDQA